MRSRTRASIELRSVLEPFLRCAKATVSTDVAPLEALRLGGGEDSLVLRVVAVEQWQRLNPQAVGSVARAEYVGSLLGVRPILCGATWRLWPRDLFNGFGGPLRLSDRAE